MSGHGTQRGHTEIEREIARGIDLLLHGTPQEALAAHRWLVEQNLPWLELRAVRNARQSGFSWAEIGRLLGRSRQAVRKRFGGGQSIDELFFTYRFRDPNNEVARQIATHIADTRRDRLAREADDAVPW